MCKPDLPRSSSLFFVLALLMPLVFTARANAQCSLGDVTLSTQAQINAFGATYTHCTDIALGNVTIAGADITDLSPLSNVKTVTGGLNIYGNPDLIPLDGFSSLTHVGDFAIADNPKLESIAGFDALKSSWTFLIIRNDKLERVNGFPVLKEVLHFIDIELNAELAEIDGFESLEITQNIIVSDNEKLVTINGLSSLKRVVSNFTISYNPELEEVSVFSSLKSVGVLRISNNPQLELIAGFSALESIESTLKISDNTGLKTIDGFDNIIGIGFNTEILDNPALTEISGLGSVASVGGNLSIRNNPALVTLSGFGSLTRIGGAFEISSTALTDFTNFSSLTTLGGAKLALENNPQLTSISGLANVDPYTIGGSAGLVVVNNGLLEICSLDNFCTYLSNSPATSPRTISGNAGACLDAAAVVAACEEALPVTLARFTAMAGEQSILLAWVTAAESNTSHFEVQRSSDGMYFQTIGEVIAAGESETTLGYHYHDIHPLMGLSYYRLKMIDLVGRGGKGAYTYSEIRSVVMDKEESEELALYPNPATVSLYLDAAGMHIAEVLLWDSAGRLVRTLPYEKDTGVSLVGLAPGVLLVEVRLTDGTRRMNRVVVQP